MKGWPPSTLALSPESDHLTPARIAVSARRRDGLVTRLADFRRSFAELGRRAFTTTQRRPLGSLAGWSSDPHTGNLRHRTGRFFTIEGLDVSVPHGPVPHWDQPIINQPEIGILGLLVKEVGGVLHCLMQAKAEPGNCNGLQLSPTVQATRSNYTRVHRGRAVPYLGYFQDTSRHRVLADVRQSEQGSWFRHKRNRNMVVEVSEDVEPEDGFYWLTIGQVHRLLAVDDMVNMDARTVLSCLPFAGVDLVDAYVPDRDGFRMSLVRSFSDHEGSLHTMDAVLSWITEARATTEVRARAVPLNQLRCWRRSEEKISPERGLFFDVIGVAVTASGREVRTWAQPMLAPGGTGVVAFLVSRIEGVLHALVQARVEPGYVDVVELAPTVQCVPASYEYLPAPARPRFLDEVLRASPGQVRFESTLSEEGGRFYHARNRYLVIETDPGAGLEGSGFRWMTLRQLVDLLRHSHYLNVQARSLVACLHSLAAAG